MYKSIKANIDKADNASKKYYDQKAHKHDININNLILLTNTYSGDLTRHPTQQFPRPQDIDTDDTSEINHYTEDAQEKEEEIEM
uniref:Uncharacterized protein n=1 Tax=Romanomermis culicivorax TaxID=13658 RepID=A0A915HHB3_ROMCU